MYRGAGFRIFSALLALAGVVALGALAYGAGYSAGSTDTSGHVAGWVYGGFFGWHILGFLIGLFFLFLVVRLVIFAIFGHRHDRWGWYPGPMPAQPGTGTTPGGAPYGVWGPSPWRWGPRHYARYAMAQAWFDEFHGRSHQSGPGENPAGGPSATSTSSTGDPGATGSGTSNTGV